MQTLVQDKLCPLRTTQWFLLLKKSEKTCSRLPEIPFFFNLQVSTLCQTLWNALEIPKKNASSFEHLRCGVRLIITG